MIIKLNQNELTAEVERNFVAMLDEFHSYPDTWNNALDDRLRKMFLEVKNVFPKKPYFSPSAAGSCPRELYLKGKGAKRDVTKRQPHQARWTRIGDAIGGIIQRDILDIEDNYEKLTGKQPPFRFLRTTDGFPAFEEFVKTNAPVRIADSNGELVTYNLFGLPDGIMEYTTESGEVIRVGLEIKSKQTTPARTSDYSMREAEDGHKQQCVAYSCMYNVDYYVILYVNAAKQSWFMDEDKYRKTPDIRAFAYEITDVDRYELLARFADIQSSINNDDTPPKLDIDKWTFNNYKTACAQSLTDVEVAELIDYKERMMSSNLKDSQKANVAQAVDEIIKLRGGDANDE